MARTLPSAEPERLPYGIEDGRLVAAGAAVALAQTAPVFALGNGFIGLRAPVDGEPRLYLNGVHERVPIAYHEAAHGYARTSDTRLAVADPTGIAIMVDGVALDGWDRLVLDMDRGRLDLIAERDGVRICCTRIVAADRDMVAQRVEVRAERSVQIRIASVIAPPPFGQAEAEGVYDPRVGPALARSPWEALAVSDDARVNRLRTSGWTVACAVSARAATLDLRAGDTRTWDCAAGIVATRGGEADLAGAARTLAGARDFEGVAAATAAWWRAFWLEAGLALPGAPEAEAALRHGLFQLAQAAGRDGRTSLAAKGQTGEGYEGHVFWDAESYALPVLVRTMPEVARAMLAWRIAGLDDARANARAMGQARGALYPWRTIGGRECSSFFPAGSAQYHINADIAFALMLYVEATGDRSILGEGGAEMLAETARIWLEIGWHDPARGDAFVINRVTGPDEYSAIVDNNLYTNMMAARHLRAAVAEGGAFLSADERDAMTRAADAMLLPFDEERGVPAQDDGFFALEPWPFAETPAERYPLLLHLHPLAIYRRQVAKQADAVLAMALMPEMWDRATRARAIETYEAVTVHDSTLSASAFAIAAARVGDGDKAARYWRLSVLTDLMDLFGNSGHGLHMAALAGGWNALVYGFAGLGFGAGLRFDPIAMGEGYAFTIRHHGTRLRVAVDVERVVYTVEIGDGLDFRHGNETISLAAGESAVRGLA